MKIEYKAEHNFHNKSWKASNSRYLISETLQAYKPLSTTLPSKLISRTTMQFSRIIAFAIVATGIIAEGPTITLTSTTTVVAPSAPTDLAIDEGGVGESSVTNLTDEGKIVIVVAPLIAAGMGGGQRGNRTSGATSMSSPGLLMAGTGGLMFAGLVLN
jgi:hypothetical protein